MKAGGAKRGSGSGETANHLNATTAATYYLFKRLTRQLTPKGLVNGPPSQRWSRRR